MTENYRSVSESSFAISRETDDSIPSSHGGCWPPLSDLRIASYILSLVLTFVELIPLFHVSGGNFASQVCMEHFHL